MYVTFRGVDSTERVTTAQLEAGARLVVKERLMTHESQSAVSVYKVYLNGEGSSADVVSRSVARDDSYQKLDACVSGNAIHVFHALRQPDGKRLGPESWPAASQE